MASEMLGEPYGEAELRRTSSGGAEKQISKIGIFRKVAFKSRRQRCMIPDSWPSGLGP